MLEGAWAAEASPEASTIQTLLSSGEVPGMGRVGRLQVPLARFYGETGFRPAWFVDGRSSGAARLALEVLGRAAQEGLDPQFYRTEFLRDRLEKAVDARERAAADLSLSLALFRFLTDLHLGRVDPRRLGHDLESGSRDFGLASQLREALRTGRLPALGDALAPRLAMYGRLRQALVRYRSLAAGPFSILPSVGRKLEPGQSYGGLAVLRERLVLAGDLAPGVPTPARYEGELVEGVKHFQERHGLEPDGVIGRGTLKELNVPWSLRVRQIELGLERLRWFRVPEADKAIWVNIPEFRLRALDIRHGVPETHFSMKVIVGKAIKEKKTPLFQEEMRSIDFRPFWNVPPSIENKELLPKLREKPGYFADQEMEFVPVGGGRVSTRVTPEALEAVAAGRLRIRQKPGSKNPLGPIKFVLPNSYDVYLHYTSSPRLFQKSRRDFSHGCIRIQEPVKLAAFVLEKQPEWTEARIKAAMEAEKSSGVQLVTPVPVMISYMTTVTDADGRVYFLPDIYDLDGKLEAALKGR